jgi:porin
MKKCFLILLFYSTLAFSQKENKAFEFSAKYTGDYAVINNDSFKHFSVYMGNIDMIVNFNTEKAGLWKGGSFSAFIINDHGVQASQKYIGELQLFSNIEAPERTKLYELWYEQMFGKNFSIKIGQQNINAEFVTTDFGFNFINSSFGIMPVVSNNAPVSIFPNTTLGARLKLKINNNCNILAGIYDGRPGTELSDKYGLDWSIQPNDGIFSIGELQYITNLNQDLPGKYKIGIWDHTADFKECADTSQTCNGNYGIYFMADQMIFAEPGDNKQGLGAFLFSGIAPKKQNLVGFGAGGGLCYTGLIANRNEDILGLSLTNATLNAEIVEKNNLHHSENIIELTYFTKIGAHLSLQPNMQYIINPAGSVNNNTFVGLLRFALLF